MSDRPNVVFFGSDAICLPVLDYLKNEATPHCTLRAVVSQPDRRQGRGKRLLPNPVAAWALENEVELLQPEKPTRELAEHLVALKTALALVMAYGHFLPRSLREAPLYGMLNFHASILPQYRGASPVETAIAMGEQQTGVCLMQIVKEMDAGGVADCEWVRIEDVDTGPDVRAKIAGAVVPLLRRNLKEALHGELVFKSQDSARATYCRKIRKEDGAIDFTRPARTIYDRLRAFTPWPGGYFDHGEDRIKVGRTEVDTVEVTAEPGTVLDTAGALKVATGSGVLCFHELQRPGGRMLPVSDFLRGYPILRGEVLTGRPTEPLVGKQP